MATSQSLTFNGDPDQIWGAIVRLVAGAGYPIIGTDQAAKQIAYEASGGGFAWAQHVNISVSSLDESEAIVTILVEAAGQATLTEGGQQRKLIQYVVDELCEHFPLAENQPVQATAPGTSGCFGILLSIIALPAAILVWLVISMAFAQ